MAALQVFLFGQLRVQRDDRCPIAIDGEKVRELFCYLLLNRRHPQSREILATLLWPDSSPPRARRNLRQALWQLQVALQPHAVGTDACSLVVAESDWISINRDADVWLDVAALEQAFAMVRGRPAHGLDATQAAQMMRAVELYTGVLLEGWYQDWCLHERERLARINRALLEKLMSYCAARGDYDGGLAYGERLLAEDPARERIHRRLMRLHYLRGDRTEALRQYDRCVATLSAELGVKPSRQTVALYERLRTDRLDTIDLSLDDPQDQPGEQLLSLPSPASSLRQILGQLAHLRGMLADVQEQLQDEIRAVEHSRRRTAPMRPIAPSITRRLLVSRTGPNDTPIDTSPTVR